MMPSHESRISVEIFFSNEPKEGSGQAQIAELLLNPHRKRQDRKI